jgi:hypothetical protein
MLGFYVYGFYIDYGPPEQAYRVFQLFQNPALNFPDRLSGLEDLFKALQAETKTDYGLISAHGCRARAILP